MTYSVGDEVQLIDVVKKTEHSTSPRAEIGDIGEIIEIYEGDLKDYPYKIDFGYKNPDKVCSEEIVAICKSHGEKLYSGERQKYICPFCREE